MSSSQRSRKALATFIFSDPKGVTFSIPSVNHGDAPIIGRSKLTTKIQQPDHFRKQLGQEKDSPKPTKLWKKKKTSFWWNPGRCESSKMSYPRCRVFRWFLRSCWFFQPFAGQNSPQLPNLVIDEGVQQRLVRRPTLRGIHMKEPHQKLQEAITRSLAKNVERWRRACQHRTAAFFLHSEKTRGMGVSSFGGWIHGGCDLEKIPDSVWRGHLTSPLKGSTFFTIQKSSPTELPGQNSQFSWMFWGIFSDWNEVSFDLKWFIPSNSNQKEWNDDVSEICLSQKIPKCLMFPFKTYIINSINHI